MSQMMLTAPDRTTLPAICICVNWRLVVFWAKLFRVLVLQDLLQVMLLISSMTLSEIEFFPHYTPSPFACLNFFFFWTPALFPSFSDAVSATLVLVKSSMPQISGISFYSSKYCFLPLRNVLPCLVWLWCEVSRFFMIWWFLVKYSCFLLLFVVVSVKTLRFLKHRSIRFTKIWSVIETYKLIDLWKPMYLSSCTFSPFCKAGQELATWSTVACPGCSAQVTCGSVLCWTC